MDQSSVPLPGPLQVPPSFPFVGRSDELARLGELWGRVGATRCLALVAGEPGAGKSRLIREFAHRVAGSDGLVLYGVGDPTSGMAYQPVVEALAHLLRHGAAEQVRGTAVRAWLACAEDGPRWLRGRCLGVGEAAEQVAEAESGPSNPAALKRRIDHTAAYQRKHH